VNGRHRHHPVYLIHRRRAGFIGNLSRLVLLWSKAPLLR